MKSKLMALATVVGAVLSFADLSAQAAGLLVADGGFGGVLEIKEHDVKVVVNNGVAVTEVEQVFVNTENRVVEALYTFPVPKGASVSNFSMWINGQEMIGEVVEKERARQIYQSYKQVRRDPGLLEQVDYKTFEMRIFPIAAGAEQRVKVTYYQELDFDHDWATFVYPLATVTRAGINEQTTGKFALNLEVKSEIPIVELESPSHRDSFVVVGHSDNYYQASLETSGGDLSRDLVLAFKTVRPRTGIDVITSKQADEDGYFMLTLTAGEELAEVNVGMDYVFVLDVSGSMALDGKLGMSRESIVAFIDSLGEADRFELMSFNVAAKPLFGKLETVGDETKDEARAFLDAQRGVGGTVLKPALSTAYQYQDSDRTLNVVVLSDGMTEQREQRELLQLIKSRPSGSRVFCIGVGNEVNRPLLQQLADDAGGLAAFISEGDSFERQATAFRRKLMRPAIKNLGIQLAGAGTFEVEPRELPDLFHGSPVRLFGRYEKSGPMQVTILGEVQGAPLNQTVEIELPQEDADNPEIERMWAWHRVDALMAAERTAGVSGMHRNDIVELCEGYSIASEYASFIVLENDAEYQRWKIDRRNAVRIARDRAAQERVRTELQRIRDRQSVQVGPQSEPSSGKSVSSQPTPADTNFQPVQSPSTTSTRPQPSTSRDVRLPQRRNSGGGGGGAIDPITGLLVLGLGGSAAWWKRRQAKC